MSEPRLKCSGMKCESAAQPGRQTTIRLCDCLKVPFFVWCASLGPDNGLFLHPFSVEASSVAMAPPAMPHPAPSPARLCTCPCCWDSWLSMLATPWAQARMLSMVALWHRWKHLGLFQTLVTDRGLDRRLIYIFLLDRNSTRRINDQRVSCFFLHYTPAPR